MAENPVRFSSRTAWNLELNRLASLAAKLRKAGRSIADLTETNPTRCGFAYDSEGILAAISDPRALVYDPQPRGLLHARQAVSRYCAAQQAAVRPDQILLTSGSSEAYAYLFRLLAEPGDNVLVPHPGYPLFDFLSRLNDVELVPYLLEYHQGWEIDFGWVEAAVNSRTRAVVLVHPNNPTGSLVRRDERERMADFCARRGLALIVDEVFLDYCLPQAAPQALSMADTAAALTFTLNGLSKTAALPQMKLGWIVTSGPGALVEQAMARLEVIADAYLSVGTPVQWALPRLLDGRHAIQRQILTRMETNLRFLDGQLAGQSVCTRLQMDGGWSVVLRVPTIHTDEEWALQLLERDGVLLHPGCFFDFAGGGYLVASLLPPADVFGEGIVRLLRRVQETLSLRH